MKIPIKAAKELSEKYDLSHVIIFAHQREPYLDHIVTFGKSLKECDEAAQFGDTLKDGLGWPEKLKTLPSRVRKFQKRIKELEAQLRDAQLQLERIPDTTGAGACLCSDNFSLDANGNCSWCHSPRHS